MQLESPYPIGSPGHKWGAKEKAQWLSAQKVQRSYAQDVLATHYCYGSLRLI